MRVPASRADIFRDRALSPADKRSLMRFLQKAQQSCLGRESGLVSHHVLLLPPSGTWMPCEPAALHHCVTLLPTF